MDETKLQALIDAFEPHLVNDDGKLDRRLLGNLCREIERETRHSATRSLYAVINAIDAKQDVSRILAKAEFESELADA